MILFALGSLLLGILCGYFLFPPEAVPVMDRLMSYALMLLLLSVGIEVGTNKTVFRKIREYNVRILVIPFGVAVGSIAGGLLLGFFLGMPVNESAAVSSGFGFYSVSAVILRGLGGAQLGTVAFMTNVLRELMAFLMIPFVARHFGRDRDGHHPAGDRAGDRRRDGADRGDFGRGAHGARAGARAAPLQPALIGNSRPEGGCFSVIKRGRESVFPAAVPDHQKNRPNRAGFLSDWSIRFFLTGLTGCGKLIYCIKMAISAEI